MRQELCITTFWGSEHKQVSKDINSFLLTHWKTGVQPQHPQGHNLWAHGHPASQTVGDPWWRAAKASGCPRCDSWCQPGPQTAWKVAKDTQNKETIYYLLGINIYLAPQVQNISAGLTDDHFGEGTDHQMLQVHPCTNICFVYWFLTMQFIIGMKRI